MDFCYDGWTDRVPQKAPTSTVAFAMVAAVPTRGVVLGNVANYLALRIEKSRRSGQSVMDANC
jgi:hypothetical protein